MPTHTPTEKMNIQISKGVVEEYHQTHSYYGNGIFECGDMANDVWNMLKTRGINAKIQIGNVDKDNATLFESNHAWVLAEVSADKWLALETTGGYLEDNPRYYGGWSFYTPKQFKKYLLLLTQFNDMLPKENEAQTQCDQLVSQYNQANIIKKDALALDLTEKLIIANHITKEFNEVILKMIALLTY
jgi:hypothetical protein